MLELKNIRKVYPAGGEDVEALKGISLQLRKNEFVAVLGPSGCGKTTMLNIVGGLDQYTSGDLVINGVSTKEYRDRDWDAYRNHSVGFVFQSYNLIPHQTVLQNVELALTLSGVSKKERRRRAKEALVRVGLEDQLKKKPGEMSGGQMQRVAIARAIVNNPDIILADEPTGALDTETSVQVMDILKEIASDRLVVMVTHNPDLAEKYATRTVRMLDGVILSDSMPLSSEEYETECAQIREQNENEAGTAGGRNRKSRKPSMSFATSFGLSLKNLFTKKGRTALTSFAGSIGIIGIALIYAVSEGTTTYINLVQEQTLSSYPITIEAKSVDMASLLETFMGKAESGEAHENDAVYQKAMIYEMMNSLSSLEEKENDLNSFKAFIEDERSEEESRLGSALSSVQYTYDLDLQVLTENVDGEIIVSDTQALMMDAMSKYSGIDMKAISAASSSPFMSQRPSMMSASKLWKEMLPGEDGRLVSDVTMEQYSLLYGSWPTRFDEIVLFVDDNNELDDLTLYALGLKSEDEIEELMQAAADRRTVEYDVESWSYEEICGMDFRIVLPADCFVRDEKTGTYSDLRDTETGLKYLYDNALPLHVTGIVKPAEGAVAASASGGIGYTYRLTQHIIAGSSESGIVNDQKNNPSIDVFTGLPFESENDSLSEKEKADAFRSRLAEMDDTGKADMFVRIMSIPSEETVQAETAGYLQSMTPEMMTETMVQALTQEMGMEESAVREYISNMSEEEIRDSFTAMTEEQIRAKYAEEAAAKAQQMTPDQLSQALVSAAEQYTDEECAAYYEEVLEFSKSTCEDNLVKLGCLDLDTPASISLYASSFADKDVIEDVIREYNDSVDDMQEIEYTDIVGILMSSVTTIINAITYVLIAFVSVSLVVSSIMIGVITLISVQERTKEIGILRAIGASKKNVASLFNAETVIIGFCSGMLGVLITYLLCIPINAILHSVTGIANLNAILPVRVAAGLVVISVLLTLTAGIIPSRSAAKKDPVVALRTE